MKSKVSCLGIVLFIIFIFNCYAQQDEFPVLKGPYLGQKPPGMTPELFAPGIVPTEDNEGLYGFFNNGTLFLFDRTPADLEEWKPAVYRMELKDGKWTQPTASPNQGKPWYHYYTTAPEGKEVYFAWKGSLGDRPSSADLNIWRVRKTNEGWTKARKLPSPVNSMDLDTFPKVTEDGTLYFFSNREGGFGGHDIYRSPSINGKHTTVENLDAPINSEYDELDPFIAPDESYLIFCSKALEGFGGFDLFITFKKLDGAWTKPVNMGEGINTSAYDWVPYVTPDGKYFFFNSTRSGSWDIYWVDAKIIEDLKPKDEFPVLKGSYLGQKQPGKIPVKFPFDYMPQGYKLHSAPAFMPGGKEVYFSAMDFSIRFSEKIFFMKIIDGTWTSPQVAPFSGNKFDGSPSISRDGRYLFYSSARKPDGEGMTETGERNIWYVERKREDWSLPQPLNFRTPGWENGSDISELGNLFFDASDIYKLKFPSEEKDQAEKLGDTINSGFTELHPCIAPDERFLVFYSSRPEHHGSEGGDLYISFRNNDGTWKQALNLGEQFNKGHLSTSFPCLSPDGKYFFFLKLVSIPWQCEVFWVSVDVLDDLNK